MGVIKSIILDHTIELWSIPTIKNLVKSSVGISYLPTFAVEKELQNGQLVEIETELTDARISAVCGYNSSKWVSPAMELFARLIADHLS